MTSFSPSPPVTSSHSTSYDLARVPIQYLELYPFPVFVVAPALNPANGRPNGRTSTPGRAGLDIIWSNGKWRELAGGRKDFEDLVSDGPALVELHDWIHYSSLLFAHPTHDTFHLTLNDPSITLPLVKVSILEVSSLAPSANAVTLHVISALSFGQEATATTPLAPGAQTRSPPDDMPLLSDSTPSTPPSPAHPSLAAAPTTRHPSYAKIQSSLLLTEQEIDCKVLLETTDWSETSLGPRSTWSPAIETLIRTIMASRTQDSLWLGPDFNMIYNRQYSQIVLHPMMFGRSAKVKEAWGPVWDGVQGLIDRCIKDGEACFRQNDLLLYRRGPTGHYVEKYHTWSFVPIFDSNGKTVLGIYNPTMETTTAVLAQRRQATTRDLAEELLVARTVREFFGGVAEVMERNPKDVPFLLCYEVEQDPEGGVNLQRRSSVGVPEGHPSASSSMHVNLTARRRGTFGPNSDHLSSPTLSSISALSGGPRIAHSFDKTSWSLNKALSSRQCVVVDDCSELVRDFSLRQWEELPVSAIVIPICSEMTSEAPHAVVIMGLNLLCPLESDYEDWILGLRAQLTSSFGSVRAYEIEQQRLVDKDRMERAKTAWFQGAAHDLRSPLTLVAGPLDDVLRTTLSPEQRQSLVLAQRNVLRIQRLVNALMDFSRIEAGQMAGRFVPTDLGSFVYDLAALFRPAVERRRVTYSINIEPNDILVYIDPTLLETAVTNLISNALKYTERGHIEVALAYTDSYADIAITDTGFGIPQAELGMVTDRFHRATTAISRGTEGTGIGLALAKEIIRLHGGYLLIESQTEQENGGEHGSRFTARIPLIAREAATDDPEMAKAFGSYGREVVTEAMHWGRNDGNSENSFSDPGDGVSNSSAHPASSRSEAFLFEKGDVLLLVDDNLEMRQYIKKIFTPFCTVVEASDGLDALQKARATPPHLILSDLMMPRMNGTELLAAIRQDPVTRIVPMLLLSAATDDELRLSALTSGAEDFLLKPFKPKELLARVHLHMQLGKRRAKYESLFMQREQELAILSDYCPSGIIRADSTGRLTYANAAWRESAGMADDADINTWPEKVEPASLARIQTKLEKLVSGEEPEVSFTYRYLTGRTVLATALRLDKIKPGMTGILGCVSDITHEEEKLVEAERRRIEAEESRQQQELLIDLTSHEIRTPVSAILQCSSLVKENLAALAEQLLHSGETGFRPTEHLMAELEEDIKALDSIYQCGLVQERIAGDILSLARIQLEMLSLHQVPTDLRREAQKIVAVFASEVKMKKIDLTLDIGPSFGRLGASTIRTDHVRLGQVITNLVANAIRFTAPSPVRRITVRLDAASRPPPDESCAFPDEDDALGIDDLPDDSPVWLFFAICDTGPGLPPNEQAILFKRFSQGNKMIHTRYGGSGLGLFICRKIAELLGGRIEVKSQLGQGSVFRFFVESRTVKVRNGDLSPVPTPEVQTALSLDGSLLSAASIQNGVFNKETLVSPVPLLTTNNPLNEQLRVLIVEDNIINQTVLKRQLVKAGLSCDVADNGQEALHRIMETENQSRAGSSGVRPYDVVLMDLEMPVMDGFTAIRHIREAERNGSLSRQMVIALTGNARQGQIDQALEAGMDEVVIKPYRLPDLLAKMRAAAAKRQETFGDGV